MVAQPFTESYNIIHQGSIGTIITYIRSMQGIERISIENVPESSENEGIEYSIKYNPELTNRTKILHHIRDNPIVESVIFA